MRETSVYSLECLCGQTVEFPDADRQAQCPKCSRTLVVAAWPNEPPVTVPAEGSHAV